MISCLSHTIDKFTRNADRKKRQGNKKPRAKSLLLDLQRIFADVLLGIDFMTFFFLEKKREIIAKNSYHMKNIAKKKIIPKWEII